MEQTVRPTLYHASSSYYSMIARLALAEAHVAYWSHPVDIHRRAQQHEPDYVRLNPHMTVPTLALPGRTLTESRDIVAFAMPDEGDETRAWVDRHYTFAVEELTFGWFLSWNPLARLMIPRALASAEHRLRERAAAHPDLAAVYTARAEVFAARQRTFDPDAASALYQDRLREARAHLDALEAALADGRATLVRAGYGPADVVWTVFLARIHFARLGEEITKRPAVSRYYEAASHRPSFEAADIWARIEPMKLLHQMFD